MSPTITMPSQYALKLPATRPDRMSSDAPPSRAEVTTSRTCAELVEVKTLTNSGMMAPASVPHVMIVASFHHSVPSPRPGISHQETRYVRPTDTSDVIHTRLVSGFSKFIVAAWPYWPRAKTSLMKYDAPLATIIMTRITKIQTRSWTWTTSLGTASRMKEMRATPVTP